MKYKITYKCNDQQHVMKVQLTEMQFPQHAIMTALYKALREIDQQLMNTDNTPNNATAFEVVEIKRVIR